MPVFETDDGRTFAGADALVLVFVVFIAFFETAVRHPAVCRSLHRRGDGETCAEAHSIDSESEKRDRGEAGEMATLARFSPFAPDYRIGVGPASSKREGDEQLKKRRRQTT